MLKREWLGERVRLLMTISDPSGGGAEREFMNLLRYLPEDRFEVHVVLWRNDSNWAPPSHVTFEVLNKTRPWHIWRTVKRLSSAIQTFKPQVVYSQLHFVNTVTGSALRRAGHASSWVARFVNDPKFEFEPGLSWWTRRSIKRADAVMAASSGAARATERFLHLPRGHVEETDNVIDVEGVTSLAKEDIVDNGGRFRFVVVGRLTRQKNHRLLLRAFAKVPNHPELWVIGKGEEERALKELATQLGIDDRLSWIGYQPNPYPYIRAADCLVLSSDAEGLPNVLIEAMIIGTPVVSTRCNYGPEELIENYRTGLLVEPGNIPEMTAALSAVMLNPAAALGRAAVALDIMRQRFDPARTVPKYVDAFHRVAAAK